VNFSAEERAELSAALSLTADMVGILLKQLDLLLDARDSGRCRSRIDPGALGNLASAAGEVALAAHGLDDRAVDKRAVVQLLAETGEQ
jgi:hypothetical protein